VNLTDADSLAEETDRDAAASAPAPKPRDVARSVERLLRSRRRHVLALAREAGLELSELAALDHLADEGDLTPGALGARLGLTSGALTRLADRLEADRLLQRVPNPADRRSVLLRITPPGRVLADRSIEAWAGDVRREYKRLGRKERLAVARFLNSLIAASENRVAQAVGPQKRPAGPEGPAG
jgi:DNA-binding MarR family transcriptional regulator